MTSTNFRGDYRTNLEAKLENNFSDDVIGEVRKYQVYENGIPVWGNKVVEKEKGSEKAFFGSLYQSKSLLGNAATIPERLAKTIALNSLERSEFEIVDYFIESVVHTIGSRKKVFAKVEFFFEDDHQIVFVDPATERTVHSFSNKQHVSVQGSGIDLNGKGWNFPVWEQNGFYYLLDPNSPSGGNSVVLDAQNLDTASAASGLPRVY